MVNGSIPGVLETVNFNTNPASNLEALKQFQPDKPLFVAEFWPGWFDHWGGKHNRMPVEEFTKAIDIILQMNASINFYPFVGGTNFGFWNGAGHNKPWNVKDPPRNYEATVTSYDYDTLISENGNVHPTKFQALRNLVKKHNLVQNLAAVPAEVKTQAFGTFKVTNFLRLDALTKLLSRKPLVLSNPKFMEYLDISNGGGQGYGWILYKKDLTRQMISTGKKKQKGLQLVGVMRDRAQIFHSRRLISTIYCNITNRLIV